MFWHIDTDAISLIVLVAIYLYYRKLSVQVTSLLQDRRFLHCLIAGIGVTAVDIAASVIMEVPTTRFLYHLMMTLYFVSVELVIVEWFSYVLPILYRDDAHKEKVIRYIMWSVYGVYALFTALNPWTGAVYTLGPNNEYTRGPFFAGMLILFALYTIVLFVLIMVRRKYIQKGYPSVMLLSTPVILAIGIVLQLSVPGLLLIMPAYMICLVFAFLFLQNMYLKNSRQLVEDLSRVAETDLLTGLFNRTGMETMVQKTLHDYFGQGVLVLIVDIDDLKQINDTLGHAGGDQAIRMVAA